MGTRSNRSMLRAGTPLGTAVAISTAISPSTITFPFATRAPTTLAVPAAPHADPGPQQIPFSTGMLRVSENSTLSEKDRDTLATLISSE